MFTLDINQIIVCGLVLSFKYIFAEVVIVVHIFAFLFLDKNCDLKKLLKLSMRNLRL